ncbi:hypothetical protein FRC08_010216 [Ceratobasidium sp. 394]|nr:hypothetical protein FRC08_010216 [Ceratobasidium sp. 394]
MSTPIPPSSEAPTASHPAPNEPVGRRLRCHKGISALSDAEVWNDDAQTIIDSDHQSWHSPVYSHYSIMSRLSSTSTASASPTSSYSGLTASITRHIMPPSSAATFRLVLGAATSPKAVTEAPRTSPEAITELGGMMWRVILAVKPEYELVELAEAVEVLKRDIIMRINRGVPVLADRII